MGHLKIDLHTAMHRAAVRRDVREVVKSGTCVKFHLLSVTGVSLRAIDQTYASKNSIDAIV